MTFNYEKNYNIKTNNSYCKRFENKIDKYICAYNIIFNKIIYSKL